MNIRNSAQQYGLVAIIMHWLMALLMLAMFALGYWMVTLGYYDDWYHQAPELHKSVGMSLMLLLVLRLGWRWWSIRPALMGKTWEKIVALTVHRLHYVIMLLLVVSGYLIPTATGQGIDLFGWFTIPSLMMLEKSSVDWLGQLHEYMAWFMLGLTAMHAAAALKHHFIDRDVTLLRMLGISTAERKNHQ